MPHAGGVLFKAPAAHPVAAQIPKAGNAPEQALPPWLRLCWLMVVREAVNIRMYGQGEPQGVIFAAQGGTGLGGQRFHKHKPHAVRVVRATGGICADARTQRRKRIKFLQLRYMPQYLLKQGHARRILGFLADNAADDLLEARGAALVDGPLQCVDFFHMGKLTGCPFAQVKKLKVGNAPTAQPQQFQHVLFRQPGKVEYNLAGMQRIDVFQQKFRRLLQNSGQILVRLVGEHNLRVGLRAEPVIAQHVGHHVGQFRQAFAQLGGTGGIGFFSQGLAQAFAAQLPHGFQMMINKFGKM